MAQDRIQTPSTSAGLMRFYDETTSSIQIDPRAIVAVCVGVILIELILQFLLK